MYTNWTLISAIIALAIIGVISIIKIGNYLTEQSSDKKRNLAMKKEKERLDALPKLNTELLLKVPGNHKKIPKGSGTPRTFGNRWNRIVICDENGEWWVGLFSPEILKGLREGEFRQENLWVPFRGDGEMMSGHPVRFAGITIDIYPDWMNQGVSLPEWVKWSVIEMKFFETYRHGRNYHEDFRTIYRGKKSN